MTNPYVFAEDWTDKQLKQYIKQLDRTIIDLDQIKQRKHMRDDIQHSVDDLMHDLDQIMCDAIGGYLYRKYLPTIKKELKLKLFFAPENTIIKAK